MSWRTQAELAGTDAMALLLRVEWGTTEETRRKENGLKTKSQREIRQQRVRSMISLFLSRSTLKHAIMPCNFFDDAAALTETEFGNRVVTQLALQQFA